MNGTPCSAGTPPEVVTQLSQALAKVLKDPAIAEQLAGIGAEPIGSTPAELDTFRRAEIEKARGQGSQSEAGLKSALNTAGPRQARLPVCRFAALGAPFLRRRGRILMRRVRIHSTGLPPASSQGVRAGRALARPTMKYRPSTASSLPIR